jgi:hypothetical protein
MGEGRHNATAYDSDHQHQQHHCKPKATQFFSGSQATGGQMKGDVRAQQCREDCEEYEIPWRRLYKKLAGRCDTEHWQESKINDCCDHRPEPPSREHGYTT